MSLTHNTHISTSDGNDYSVYFEMEDDEPIPTGVYFYGLQGCPDLVELLNEEILDEIIEILYEEVENGEDA